MNVRHFKSGDEQEISDIYNYYITDTVITFEEEPLTALQMRERIDSYMAGYPWLVYELDGQIVGYSYANKFHQRAAYRFTAEVTVYVRHGHKRRGIGKALYSSLFEHLANSNCHTVLAAIALPNEDSVGLHEAFGFKKVGHFSEVGRKFDQWIDVGYWQKNLLRA